MAVPGRFSWVRLSTYNGEYLAQSYVIVSTGIGIPFWSVLLISCTFGKNKRALDPPNHHPFSKFLNLNQPRAMLNNVLISFNCENERFKDDILCFYWTDSYLGSMSSKVSTMPVTIIICIRSVTNVPEKYVLWICTVKSHLNLRNTSLSWDKCVLHTNVLWFCVYDSWFIIRAKSLWCLRVGNQLCFLIHAM